MIINDLDERMKACEQFKDIQVPNNSYIILRIDGNNFSKLTENFEKPFDDVFAYGMRMITEHLVRRFDAIFGMTHSDEISLLLSKNYNGYNRRVEKLASLSASIAAAVASRQQIFADSMPAFDSRVWCSPLLEDVFEYFK